MDEYEGAVSKAVDGEVSQPQDVGWHAGAILLRNFTTYDLREQQDPEEGQPSQVEALTSDQLRIVIEAACRYRIERDAVRDIYLTIGGEGVARRIAAPADREPDELYVEGGREAGAAAPSPSGRFGASRSRP